MTEAENYIRKFLKSFAKHAKQQNVESQKVLLSTTPTKTPLKTTPVKNLHSNAKQAVQNILEAAE